jgi:hypothetical protein
VIGLLLDEHISPELLSRLAEVQYLRATLVQAADFPADSAFF